MSAYVFNLLVSNCYIINVKRTASKTV